MVTEQLKRDKSMLDWVKADVERLQGRLGASRR